MTKWLIGSLYVVDPTNTPPIRLGYAQMKIIKHFDFKKLKKLDSNYLVIKNKKTKYFSFNQYKTDKTYGQVNIDIGKKLNNILTALEKAGEEIIDSGKIKGKTKRIITQKIVGKKQDLVKINEWWNEKQGSQDYNY